MAHPRLNFVAVSGVGDVAQIGVERVAEEKDARRHQILDIHHLGLGSGRINVAHQDVVVGARYGVFQLV